MADEVWLCEENESFDGWRVHFASPKDEEWGGGRGEEARKSEKRRNRMKRNEKEKKKDIDSRFIAVLR